jgi:hypothetical protein
MSGVVARVVRHTRRLAVRMEGVGALWVDRGDGKQEVGGQITESTQVWTVQGSTLTVETISARGTQKRVYKK